MTAVRGQGLVIETGERETDLATTVGGNLAVVGGWVGLACAAIAVLLVTLEYIQYVVDLASACSTVDFYTYCCVYYKYISNQSHHRR